MRTERNIANILIAKNGTKTLTHSGNIDDYLSGMNTGEPVVLTPGGIIVNAAGTLPSEFKLATKLASGLLNYSDIIKVSSIKSIQVNRYVAATGQVDYIGYNGTSGSIEVINNNIYTVRLYLIPTDTAGFMQQKIKRGVFKSDSSATQAEIAAGLVKSLLFNFSREPEKIKFGTNRIAFERVNSAAVSNALGTATLGVTKGSTAILFSEDMTSLVTAGTILRIGGLGAGTSPCYVVESTDGGAAAARVYFLDVPWQGATNLAIAANLVESVAAGGDWGIKITGTAYSFDPPKYNYSIPRWKTNLQDAGSTTITESTKPSEGQGDYRTVSSMEQQFQGNEGNYYRAQVPSPTFRTETLSTATYALIVIEFVDKMQSTIGGYEVSNKQLYIACEKAATGSHFVDANTGLATFLTALVTAGTVCNVANVATEIAAA